MCRVVCQKSRIFPCREHQQSAGPPEHDRIFWKPRDCLLTLHARDCAKVAFSSVKLVGPRGLVCLPQMQHRNGLGQQWLCFLRLDWKGQIRATASTQTVGLGLFQVICTNLGQRSGRQSDKTRAGSNATVFTTQRL